jgi:hypothetical protein
MIQDNQNNRAMNLFKKHRDMDKSHLEKISILLKEEGSGIELTDLLCNRPTHHISAWRNVAFFILHSRMGITQNTISVWFKVTERTVWRGINLTKKIVEGIGEDSKQLNKIINKVCTA